MMTQWNEFREVKNAALNEIPYIVAFELIPNLCFLLKLPLTLLDWLMADDLTSKFKKMNVGRFIETLSSSLYFIYLPDELVIAFLPFLL